MEIPVADGEFMPAQLTASGAPTQVWDGDGGAEPTVIVVPDIYGPSEFYLDLCARLSSQGLAAIMPDYFFRQGSLEEHSFQAAARRRAELDETNTLDDLSAVIAWLRGRARDPLAPVGVLGFCMGATFALDLAALDPGLVTVAYYGFPVPQAGLTAPPPAPLGLAAQMRGPILAFWGELDATVGTDNIESFVAAMRDSPADFEHQVYPGLGHGFLAQAQLADDPAVDDDASRSWALARQHFNRHLQTE